MRLILALLAASLTGPAQDLTMSSSSLTANIRLGRNKARVGAEIAGALCA